MEEILKKITPDYELNLPPERKRTIDREKLSHLLASYEKRIEDLTNLVEILRNELNFHYKNAEHKEPTPQKECEDKLYNEYLNKIGKHFYKKILPPMEFNPPKTDWADELPEVIKTLKDIPGKNLYLHSFISNLLSEKQKETREEIGREFKEWYLAGKTESLESYEVIESAIERILGVQVY